MLVLIEFSPAQAVDECTSGIDVTSAPYSADRTGAADSSSAFNAAIVAAGGVGTVKFARSQQGLERVTIFPVILRKESKAKQPRRHCVRAAGHLYDVGGHQH